MTSPSEPEKLCESCGKPEANHRDAWGRWEPCAESIMDTLAFHEQAAADWYDTTADREDTRDHYPFAGDR